MKPPRLYRWFTKRSLLVAAVLLLGLSYLFSTLLLAKPSIGAEQTLLQRYIQNQQTDFQQLLKDSTLLRHLVQQTESVADFERLHNKPYGIFVFAETISNNPQALFWNNHKLLPPNVNFELRDGVYAQKEENGFFVLQKKSIRLPGISSNVSAYALIPVKFEYKMPSLYFSDRFAHNNSAHERVLIDTVGTAYPIQSIEGKLLFYLRNNEAAAPPVSTVAMVLQIAAIILLLAFIHFTSEALIRKKGITLGFAFLLLALLFVRLLLYFLPTFFDFLQTPLFDPKVFEANPVIRSLGDLLINALFLCWVVVFAWFSTGPHRRLPYWLQGRWLIAAGMVALFFLVFATFQLASVARTLVANSSISFDVSNFFSLSYYTAIGFVVLALLSLGYYYFTRLLFRVIKGALQKSVFIYFALALAGLLYLTFLPGSVHIGFHLPVLAWLIIYTIILNDNFPLINRFRITITGVLFWIIVFSASLAAIMLKENGLKELKARMQYARELNEQTASASQNALNISVRYINNRFLNNNFERLTDPGQQKRLRDSLLNTSLSPGFFSRYNVNFYLFDTTGKGIFNTDSISFNELNEIYISRGEVTGNPDLRMFQRRYNEYAYITKRTIEDTSGVKGTMFYIATPKQFRNEGYSFELFRQVARKHLDNEQDYAYAIYKGDTLVKSNSDFITFTTQLDRMELAPGEFDRKLEGGYDMLWFNAGAEKRSEPGRRQEPDRVFIVVKKQEALLEIITLFSYLFCAFLLMIAFLKIIAIILRSGNNWRQIRNFWQLNIRTQIQAIVIFVSVLSFIIIGVVTISFYIERYNRDNVENLLRYAGVLENEVVETLPALNDSTYTDTTGGLWYMQRLQSHVDRVAEIFEIDVNVYDVSGNLLVTTAPNLYEYNILSNKMDPRAYYSLRRKQQVQYLQKESLSSLDYLSIYSAIRDENGETRNYVNIPYYASEFGLQKEISNFLVALINLNAFVFLIAGTIAVVITNRITRSFSLIGDKMKAVTLGRTNEEIVWNRNDEIGELVTQYNKMVRQLEQSAEALAKSEREGAWREMARQVAHEIKNPLTPMKLSIQYLQKAITNGSSNVKELTTNVASTLIEQIDHLSKIAADFGRFANIGNRHLEVFDLHITLESLNELYNTNPDIQLSWQRLDVPLVIEADKTHMNRLFTNLLANAVDACRNQVTCQIQIIETLNEESVQIELKDNGEGIPEEMQPKIFTPNFTTKTSGTGLGLAICKSIVEQAGGDIWFETEQGVGTSFFVSLPLSDKGSFFTGL